MKNFFLMYAVFAILVLGVLFLFYPYDDPGEYADVANYLIFPLLFQTYGAFSFVFDVVNIFHFSIVLTLGALIIAPLVRKKIKKTASVLV